MICVQTLWLIHSGTFLQLTFLISLLRKSLFSFLTSLIKFSARLICNHLLLLVFSVFKLLLVIDHLAFDVQILKFFHSIELLELLSKVTHQGRNVLIRSQLTSITNRNTTKWTFFLALSIVSLDTVGAESMQTGLVNDRVCDHLLANWTGQVLHYTSNEVSADCIV